MTEKNRVEINARAVFIVLAAAVGFFIGGETIRYIYGNSGGVIINEESAPPASAQPRMYAPIDGVPDPEYEWFSGYPEGRVLAGRRENAIVRAARRVAPSVVGIVVMQIQVVGTTAGDNMFDFFFGSNVRPHRFRQIENIGSGFIISEDGMIITNFHVVRNASQIYINFTDGRRSQGRVVGVDEKTDIAVIAPIETGGAYKPVKFGNSDECLIGEWSIALGNPFLNFINDASPSLTLGVISALNRDFAPSHGVYYRGMIQTDAPINHGNSGGPLLNANAEVIGINSFIYTGSALQTGSVGMGFAIPINRARKVARELITYGSRRPVYTGIAVRDLTGETYELHGGVEIVNVRQGSPGSDAGLNAGDIIHNINGKAINSSSDLDGFFLDYFVGDTISMLISRDGRVQTLPLILSAHP